MYLGQFTVTHACKEIYDAACRYIHIDGTVYSKMKTVLRLLRHVQHIPAGHPYTKHHNTSKYLGTEGTEGTEKLCTQYSHMHTIVLHFRSKAVNIILFPIEDSVTYL